MNSEHLSDDDDDEQVHVQGAPGYGVRAEIIDEQGQRHQGFLAVTPSELGKLNTKRPETWPAGTRAVADGSLYSLLLPGNVRVWKRIGEDRTQRPEPKLVRPSAPVPGQRWVQGRWERGADGKMVWVEGHYEQAQGRPAVPPGGRPPNPRPAPPGGGAPRPRPAPPPGGGYAPPGGGYAPRPRPAPPPGGRPPSPRPAPPPHPRPAPGPAWPPEPPARRGPPSPHRDFDCSYSAEFDPSWGAHVHAVYDDGSIALHDGRTFGPQDVEQYYGDGLILLRDGQQFAPPEGSRPVHTGMVTAWAAPVGVPGPEAAVHKGVVFAGLPPGTIFFDEDHSFGFQTPQGELVTGYWSPDGTYEIEDPQIEEVRRAAAEGAAEGVASALEAMGGVGGYDNTYDDGLLSLLE